MSSDPRLPESHAPLPSYSGRSCVVRLNLDASVAAPALHFAHNRTCAAER